LETNKIHITNSDCKTDRLQDFKIDLTDVTFFVHLRIDSNERMESIVTLINYTFLHFKTNFIVLEVDSEQRFSKEINHEGFLYKFIEDNDKVFHRTKWGNRVISKSEVPFVGVWDEDVIAPPEQIIEAVEKLRRNEAVLSYPYDGRFYSCDKVSCDLYKRLLNIEISMKIVPLMKLMHGYHSIGGTFIINKDRYLNIGCENELTSEKEIEDTERLKRIGMLNLPVSNLYGPLFHMWHPESKTNLYIDINHNITNRIGLLNTCKIT